MRHIRRRQGERGAALVEFAVIAPLLLILVLGIVEFGWLFGQYNDVKHGAREGARFAAVNGGVDSGTSSTDIAIRACEAMEGLNAGMSSIAIELTLVDDDNDLSIERGETGTIAVTADVNSLSNVPLISTFLPDTLSSEIDFRLERDPSWVGTGGTPIVFTTSCS